jgi:hypothetical protein
VIVLGAREEDEEILLVEFGITIQDSRSKDAGVGESVSGIVVPVDVKPDKRTPTGPFEAAAGPCGSQ